MPFALSTAVALVMIGPGLGSGSLFQLDRTLIDDPPFPWGTVGIGPEIPRDAPLAALLWVVSAVIGAELAGKLLMVICIVGASMGMQRLTRGSGPSASMTSAMLYALSPWLLTRLAVGHQAMWVTAAVLPWVFPALADARSSTRRMTLACAAMCAAGSLGGITAGLVLLSRSATRAHRRHLLRHVGVLVGVSLVWLVPGMVVLVGRQRISSSAAFPNGTSSVLELFELAAGHGFWQEQLEVSIGSDLVISLIGIVLVAGAAFGHRCLPPAWRSTALAGAAITGVLSIATALPGLRTISETVTATAVGAPFREPQRYLVLYLLWMSAAVPLGAAHLARRVPRWRELVLVTPVVCALLLAAPGVWGLGGRLDPVPTPAGWLMARDRVRAEGGTTLALPWNRYIALRSLGVPRTLHPLPKLFGTDVLASSDLGLGGPSQERSDPREDHAAVLALDLITNDNPGVARQLAALGVRWVALLHDGPYELYLDGIASSGLVRVIERPDIELFEVPGWRGDATDGAGQPVDIDGHALTAGTDATGAFTWYRGAQAGWLRGWTPISENASGLRSVPAGDGPIWFWPAALVIAIDTAVGAVIAAAAVTEIRHRHRHRTHRSPRTA
jgi:hypothetical protein